LVPEKVSDFGVTIVTLIEMASPSDQQARMVVTMSNTKLNLGQPDRHPKDHV
jgi:hypothetical protein